MRIHNLSSARRVFSLLDEFKRFSFRGNVIDLAVAVIIGAAFTKITDSLVKHILMPTIGILFPAEKGYLTWKVRAGGQEILYGLFIGEVVNFLIVSLAIFLFIVKFLGWAARSRKKEEEEAAPPPVLTADQELLTEIRDLLKAGAGRGP